MKILKRVFSHFFCVLSCVGFFREVVCARSMQKCRWANTMYTIQFKRNEKCSFPSGWWPPTQHSFAYPKLTRFHMSPCIQKDPKNTNFDGESQGADRFAGSATHTLCAAPWQQRSLGREPCGQLSPGPPKRWHEIMLVFTVLSFGHVSKWRALLGAPK